MEKRYWSNLSNSEKESLKVLWQNSSNIYQDNYNGFSAWLLDNYNIIIDSKDNTKKETKIFGYIMIVLGCILIGISLAIIIMSNNGKNKLIEVLESDGYYCDYDKSICQIDDGLSGRRIVDFDNNEFKILAYNEVTNIIVIYNWKKDTLEYYLGTDNSLLVKSSIDKYGNLICHNSYNDCEKMRYVMNEVKEYFKQYLKDNNINFLN